MKKALGKGIKAFIPEEYGILKAESFTELDIDQLSPSPFQPRVKFDDQAISELAQSIKETGILQPILAVPAGGRYNIVIGERRWRAAQRAGLRKVPVIIRNLSKERQMEASIIENLQRADLNPIEIARSLKGWIEVIGYIPGGSGRKSRQGQGHGGQFPPVAQSPGLRPDHASSGEDLDGPCPGHSRN